MTFTVVSSHPAVLSAPGDAPDKTRAGDEQNPRIGLAQLDRIALDGIPDVRDVGAIVRWVEDSASSLAGSDRENARIRLTARAIGCERARMLELEGLLDEHLLARDFEGTAAIDKLLTSTTKRLAILLAEHRAACSAGHRPTVVVGHADAVHVEGADR